MPNLHGNFSAKTAVETVLNVPDNTWTALPTTAMGDRNLVEVFNKGENRLYFSFDSTTIIKFRSAIGTGEFKMFPIQDNVILYARSHSGGTRAIITEYK